MHVFLWVGTESHRRHSQGARVIKCDSTVYIIRLPLPALVCKAICCFPRQLELSDAPIERRSHTYFTILSILQILAFSRNFYYLSIIYFICLNYDSNSHSARQAESERENVSSAKLPFPCYSKHLHKPFVGRRLVREEVSTCLLCYSEEGQQCELDPLQITRLKKEIYIT